MKKLTTMLVLMVTLLTDSVRMRQSKISRILHTQFAGSAGSACCRKRPNLNRGTGIPVPQLFKARPDCLSKNTRRNRILRIPPVGGGSPFTCDQCSHRPSACRRSVLHGLYV